MGNVCELIDVSKSYKDHVVLNRINMQVRQDEMIAIMGKSGAGKTTILNIIGLIEKPDGGVVKLFGRRSPAIGSGWANRMLRSRISYLFQNGALIDEETVDYNLEIALSYSGKTRKEKQKLKNDALEKVSLPGVLRKKVYTLSGGEQQRVAVARILLKPSDLVLADEPTGSLDAENRDEMLRLLRELNTAGRALVVVSHDHHVAQACDRVIELEQL